MNSNNSHPEDSTREWGCLLFVFILVGLLFGFGWALLAVLALLIPFLIPVIILLIVFSLLGGCLSDMDE